MRLCFISDNCPILHTNHEFSKKYMKSNFLQLSRKLTELRNERAFNVNEYLEAKSEKLKAFFNSSGIDAIVIGLSGGVDSALGAALMCKIANEKKSPLKKVSAKILKGFTKSILTNIR